ncbi:ikaros family zinc finger protein-like [Littorina saxatilis]|uniref:C2H2-type domain-containing protein n=1 Tax=Littorina saxatilis TaxID=31220 RepID=A0AAN9GIU1_9CAEN
MDLSYTPHDEHPRSSQEPQPSLQTHQQAEVTISVAMVRPGNGICSDSTATDDETSTTTTFRPITSSPGNGTEEREVNGRPSSAPARTPTSAMDATPSPRPRVTRPLGTIQALGMHNNMVDMAASPHPRFIPPSDDLDSSRDDATPDRFSQLSPGLNGEPRYQCDFCSFSTHHLVHMRNHLTNHNSEHRTLKCHVCGYSTEEKCQFRRHKRTHQRTNPTSMLHCDKCHFSTLTPRKMREHYSRSHNEDFGASFISASMHMRTSTFNANPGLNRVSAGVDAGYILDMNSSRALHNYRLSQPRGTLQFDPGDPSSSIMPGCANTGFSPPSVFPAFRFGAERRLVLSDDHLGPPDTLSSLRTSMLTPRIPVTSTVTSCEYPARPANPHRPDLNNPSPLRNQNSAQSSFRAHCRSPFQPLHSPGRHRHPMTLMHGEGVKVKIEPIDCDGVSDVSSSGVPGFMLERGGVDRDRSQRYVEPQTSNQRGYLRPVYNTTPSRSFEQSNEIAPSASDVSRVSQSSEAASTRVSTQPESTGQSQRGGRRGSVDDGDSLGQHLLFSIKSETSNVAVQCSGPSGMKAESAATVTVAAAEHSTECRRQSHQLLIERGVQCELLSSSPRRVTTRTLSTDSEQQSFSGSESRCAHCGITFEDEVLFSIHIGCHSHTDPFVCNVCGKKCHNKYGFYSHIMRGHHF